MTNLEQFKKEKREELALTYAQKNGDRKVLSHEPELIESLVIFQDSLIDETAKLVREEELSLPYLSLAADPKGEVFINGVSFLPKKQVAQEILEEVEKSDAYVYIADIKDFITKKYL